MNDLSALDRVKGALGLLLIDFKNWTMADTKAFAQWKSLASNEAFKVVPARMIDDAESMLAKYRQIESEQGYVAPLPVMLVAMAHMLSPPDVSSLRGVPYWLDTMVPTDTENRRIKLRTVPRQYRVQLAFVSAEGDTAQGVINQFCTYMTDEAKRRFTAEYDLGGGVKDKWHLTVMENSLYPDTVPTSQNNITIATVDFQLIGLLPQVVGLNPGDPNQDSVNPGDSNVDPDARNPGADGAEWGVVVEADLYPEEARSNENTIWRTTADPVTGERKIERVPKP